MIRAPNSLTDSHKIHLDDNTTYAFESNEKSRGKKFYLYFHAVDVTGRQGISMTPSFPNHLSF
jgi:hypothetical protein